MTKKKILVGVIAVMLFFGVFIYTRKDFNTDLEVASNQNTNTEEVENTSPYKNGTYTATGNYISPGGREEISVSVTLANGVVTSSSFAPSSENSTSMLFQTDFAENYKQFVVGKSIEELKLTKVSGSSLTPVGFNDALTKIKTQAAL